jgi:hypothetical protein
MKLPQPRLIAALLLALGVSFLSSSTSRAALLLDDSFADASLSETNLPTESEFFVSHPSAVTMLPNTLRYDIQSGSTRAHVYFATDGKYSELGVGDTLSASITFIPRVSMNFDDDSRSFRFGLFFDPTDPKILNNTNDDGGGGSATTAPFDPWQDAQGYGVNIAMLSDPSNTVAPFSTGKRVNNNTSLLGSGGAYVFASSGGAPATLGANLEYTYTMDIAKISATQTDITLSLSQTGVGLLSSQTVSDDGTTFGAGLPFDRFDFLHIRWSNDTETADIFDIKRILVTGPDLVPEPASLVLLCTAALPLLGRRRAG